MTAALNDDLDDPSDNEPGAVDQDTLETELAARVVMALKMIPTGIHNVNQRPTARETILAAAVHIARLVQEAGLDQPVSEEEQVAFAFTHPEWAAAGFNATDRQEIDLYDGDIGKARNIRAAGLSAWDTAGRFHAIPREFLQAGFADPFTVDAWKERGFSAPTAKAWVSSGFTPDDADTWNQAGYTADEASEWQTACVAAGKTGSSKDTVKAADPWRNAGFAPDEMVDWVASGNTARTAAAARKKGQAPSGSARLGPNGIPGTSWQRATTVLAEAGFSTAHPEQIRSGFKMRVNRPGTTDEMAEMIFNPNGSIQTVWEVGGQRRRSSVPMRDLPQVLRLWAKSR